MDLEGLQVFSHEVPGYKPQVDFDTWRVALLNAPDMYLPANITYFDHHLETDEVFILLSGSCALLLAGNDEKPHDSLGTSLIESAFLSNRILPRFEFRGKRCMSLPFFFCQR